MASYHREALAQARAGNWDGAHEIVQDHDDDFSCRIHAYLHRVEGDLPNAQYWYRRAKVEQCTDSLDEELDRLCRLAADHAD